MKRVGRITKDGKSVSLLDAMCSYDNILIAYNKARKCKRYRPEVLRFTRTKEEKIEKVRRDIKELTYEQGAYRYFKVYEPKERHNGAAVL